MKRLLTSSVLLLALGTVGTVAAPVALDADIASAHAQDRKDKEDRKVLGLDTINIQTQMSEAYRAAARDKRREAMGFLEDILRNRPPKGVQKAEMLLRLADLYFEEGRDLYLSEMEAFNAEYDKCFNDEKCAATNLEGMKADNEESRKWQEKSIRLYRNILQNYPQYQRADEATFYLGSALQDIGEKDEAVKQFNELTRTYPDSQYVPDSYVLIGEYYFDNNNAYKALLAYQKATRFKDSPKWAFAMYKLAWCYYNVGEYGKAIDHMKAVVAFSMADQSGDSSKLTLQEEALKDLVRFFADAGNLQEAIDYFNKLGKQDLIEAMLKRLAAQYFENGEFEQAITTFRRLIAENPNSKKAPEYQNEIILAYQKMGRKKETMGEIDRLLKTYGKNSSWARQNSSDPDTVKDAQEYIEKNLRTVAINYHAEAKKLGAGRAAAEAYELAEQAYNVYLTEFPESKNSYEMRYAFGELLYKVKKYDQAYDQYMKVVQIDPKGKRSEFCAESAIFAAEEMIKVEEREGKIKKAEGKSTEPVELSEWEQKMLAACDQYTQHFKEEKKARNVIYKSAYLLYNKNQFKQASDRFRIVIGMDPQSKEAEQAANLILDSFNLVEDWANLKDVSKAFYDQQGLGSAKFKQEVYAVYERASFKLIEINYEKDKNAVAAADAFVAFVDEFSKSEVADLALNNAAAYYYKEGRVGRAMDTRLRLIENHPKSKYYNNQVASLGYDYESVADFDEAAKWYEKIFALDTAHESSKDAIYSAGLFRRAMSQGDQAVKDFNAFITTYPDDERVTPIVLEIAQIHEEKGDWDEAANVYFDFFNKPRPDATIDQLYFARLRYGKALEKENQQAKADKHWKATLAAWEKDKAQPHELAPNFIAEIMFKEAQPELKAYVDMKITGTSSTNRKAIDKALQSQLVAKAKALQGVETTFGEILKTGSGEWGLASATVLGEAYENMAWTLNCDNSYVPSYLTEGQREIYCMGLEDKAYVQTEKAAAAYALALEKAYELNLYNQNTAKATRRLGELRPDEFPELEEDLLTPRYVSKDVVVFSYEETP
ncbi:MAG: tetratricopeptide repeat protein [Alphaproteobacteria bacterium]|nr:tetratricopeptide repeat protein [Alphaproteobacteria bacterium]